VAFFLGIDAGGTKTECLIGDERRVLGRSQGTTIKIRKVGSDAAAQALEAAIAAVSENSGVPVQNIAHTCIGISGSSIPEVADWTYSMLKQLVSGEVTVVNDTLVAHHAAFHGEPGVLVIAGTGSNVLGINEQRQTARAGGWGPNISDEGSGFWIGRTAVAKAMRARDAGESSDLLDAIRHAWNVTGIEEVVSIANSNPPPDFASLLPEIVRCADSGDALAQEILAAAAYELAQLASIVITRLWPVSGEISIATTGGVFVHAARVREAFIQAVGAKRAQVTVKPDPVHPVEGALALAKRGTGVTL
jgi:N-acetylglucosamine kinase-like BadF-type ATPase